MPNPIPGWRDAPFRSDGTQDLTHAGSPPSWNALVLNSERMPGLFRVLSITHKLVKFHGRSSGKSPGAPTVRGREPGVIVGELMLRDNAEWDAYVEAAPRLLPVIVKGKQNPPTAGAVQISYPLVAAHGIRWVIVESIEARGPAGGGPCIVKIVFEETQDPTNVTVSQAKPKPTALEAAPIIAIAGEAPRPANLRDTARKPLQNAR